VAELLGEEGDAALRKSAPIAWRILRARGLLATPSPHGAVVDPAHAGAVPRKRGSAGANAAQEFLRSLRARQCRARKKRAACRQWR
jgi:hypothetical protein